MKCAPIGIQIYCMREAPNTHMRYIGMAGCGILSGDKATVEAALRQLLDQEIAGDGNNCRDLLSVLDTHPDLRGKVVEVFASFAREEGVRGVAESCGVVSRLCPLLASEESTVHLHTLRAIGNLCFDHDGNRELVLSGGGCPLLVERLTSSSLLPAEREFDRIKLVSCGCLLNVANDNEQLCQEMLKCGVVQPLCALLARPGEDSATFEMGLEALHVLLAASGGQSVLLPPSSLSQAFSSLLDQWVSGELTDQLQQSLLETIEVAITANEDLKVSLVESGCVDKLTQIADPSLQLKAINLLILICANDESLKLLSGQSLLVTTAMEWLNEPTPLKQRANSACLLGNMARTDEMCERFVSLGLVELLLPLTQMEEPEELSGEVHPAALSALRNLCLPASLKPVLLEKGVLASALRCLRDSKWHHVHFKCLGIARLLSTLPEVCQKLVIGDSGTVALVCERCTAPDIPVPHIRIEGSRLLCAVVKHCQSEEVMRMVANEGGVKLMVSLLDSAHVSLRNEALIALNLLAVLGEEIGTSLAEDNVVGGVWGVVSASDSSPELVSNAMTFLLQLHNTVGVGEKLMGLDGWTEKLQTLSQHTSESVSEIAKQLTKISLEQT